MIPSLPLLSCELSVSVKENPDRKKKKKKKLRLTFIPRIEKIFGLFDLLFYSKPKNKLLFLKLHTSFLPCRHFLLNCCMRRDNNLRTD